MYKVTQGLTLNNNIILSTNTISVASGHILDLSTNIQYQIAPAVLTRLSNATNYVYYNMLEKKYVVSTVELCEHPIGICVGSVTTGIGSVKGLNDLVLASKSAANWRTKISPDWKSLDQSSTYAFKCADQLSPTVGRLSSASVNEVLTLTNF